MAKKKITSKKKSSTKANGRKKTATGKKKTTQKKRSTAKSPSATSSGKKKKTTGGKSKKSTQKKTTKKTPAKASKKRASKAKSTKKTTARRKKTTKSAQPAKSTRPTKKSASAADLSQTHNNGEQQLTEAQMRKVKTGLTRKDLKHFQQLLLEKRAEIVGDVASLDLSRNGGGELSHMPLHMADIGSDNYEQEFTLGLVESERRLLREIDEALVRISNGTYGVCVVSGKPIGKPRLEVQPWAKYCIDVARQRERPR